MRAFLHGQAAFASLALGVYFAGPVAGQPGARLAFVIFALSQCALYTASTLYHGVPWERGWKKRMQRVDHAMIYVKIAGTLTPLAWLALEAPLRGLVLAGAWGIAGLGIAQKIWVPSLPERVSIPAQVVQAGLGVPALLALAQRSPFETTALAIGGAALYTLGLVVFLTERPRLWPRFFSHHELFHVFVVAGSCAYFALALHFLAP